MPDEAFKPLGAISITLASATLAFIVLRWSKGTAAASISKHAGSQRTSYLLFGSVLTFVGAAFYLFLWKWFGPAIGAGWPFYVIVALAGAFQLATAWLPDNGKDRRMSRAHGVVAFNMARMMMLLVACVAVAPHVGTLARSFSLLTFIGMALFWCLYVFVKSMRRYFLVYQSVYIGSFYIAVLLATYVR